MRNIPILCAGVALSIVVAIASGVLTSFEVWRTSSIAVIVITGAGYAAPVVLSIGCVELASRLRGRERFGAKLAAGGLALGLVVELVNQMVLAWLQSRAVYGALAYVGLGVSTITTIGFIIAAWPQRRAAIGAGSVALIAIVAPYIWPALVGKAISGDSAWILFGLCFAAASTVHVIALFWLAHRAQPAQAVPSLPLAVRGLRWMARALWWRLAATSGFAVLSVAVTNGWAVGLFELALVVQIGVELVVLGTFGVGALALARAALPDSPRRTFALGGLAATWCAGVMLAKMPPAYLILHDFSAVSGSMQLIERQSIGEHFVALVAFALVALALRGIPALVPLADLVSSRTLAFACLMLASIGLTSFGAEHASSSDAALGIAVLAACASVAATALMAGVLGRAADALERQQPELPTATVV